VKLLPGCRTFSKEKFSSLCLPKTHPSTRDQLIASPKVSRFDFLPFFFSWKDSPPLPFLYNTIADGGFSFNLFFFILGEARGLLRREVPRASLVFPFSS